MSRIVACLELRHLIGEVRRTRPHASRPTTGTLSPPASPVAGGLLTLLRHDLRQVDAAETEVFAAGRAPAIRFQSHDGSHCIAVADFHSYGISATARQRLARVVAEASGATPHADLFVLGDNELLRVGRAHTRYHRTRRHTSLCANVGTTGLDAHLDATHGGHTWATDTSGGATVPDWSGDPSQLH